MDIRRAGTRPAAVVILAKRPHQYINHKDRACPPMEPRLDSIRRLDNRKAIRHKIISQINRNTVGLGPRPAMVNLSSRTVSPRKLPTLVWDLLHHRMASQTPLTHHNNRTQAMASILPKICNTGFQDHHWRNILQLTARLVKLAAQALMNCTRLHRLRTRFQANHHLLAKQALRVLMKCIRHL